MKLLLLSTFFSIKRNFSNQMFALITPTSLMVEVILISCNGLVLPLWLLKSPSKHTWNHSFKRLSIFLLHVFLLKNTCRILVFMPNFSMEVFKILHCSLYFCACKCQLPKVWTWIVLFISSVFSLASNQTIFLLNRYFIDFIIWMGKYISKSEYIFHHYFTRR